MTNVWIFVLCHIDRIYKKPNHFFDCRVVSLHIACLGRGDIMHVLHFLTFLLSRKC